MLTNEKLLTLVSNRYLELILLPTEQCNFRCTYCYEDFKIGKMQRHTVEAVKKLIANRVPTLNHLKISWFGGEPLAAKDIVFDISEFVINLTNDFPALKYSSGMTTNAYSLNTSILSKLVSLGIKSYQISLDGTEDLHNRSRIRMDGAGTFQKIWTNLLAAKATHLDFSIMLRIHLTPDNLTDIYQLIDQIKMSFGGDKRFYVFFKAIENLGGPNSGTFKVMHGKEKHEIIKQFYNYLGDEVGLKKLEDNGPYVCYAAQTNSFVIRASGVIAKCTVTFSDDRNYLGRLQDNGTMEINNNKLLLWSRGLKSQNLQELSCPMSRMPKLNSVLNNIPIVIKAS